MDLKALWQGILQKIVRPKQPLELTVVDQRVLQVLLEVPQAGAHQLQSSINRDWRADRIEIAAALHKLELAGYVKELPNTEGEGPRYQVTKAAYRIRYLIPHNPRSNMDLWI